MINRERRARVWQRLRDGDQ